MQGMWPSVHGICRTIGVNIRWLMDFLVACVATVSDHLHVLPIAFSREVLLGCLEAEVDELWSFVQQKADPR